MDAPKPYREALKGEEFPKTLTLEEFYTPLLKFLKFGTHFFATLPRGSHSRADFEGGRSRALTLLRDSAAQSCRDSCPSPVSD